MIPYKPLWQDGPLFAQASHFRLSTDSVLLADFVHVPSQAKGIDLGCASGILPLLLLVRYPRIRMTGIELLPEAATLARQTLKRNGLSERAEILCGDLREHRKLFRSGSFDFVVSNPPYYSPEAGAVSSDRDRAAARSEITCTLEDVCSAASFLCRSGGRFFLVHKPERLPEVLSLLCGKGLEPKRLRFVSKAPESSPSLVLIEARRGGKPGLKIEPSLFLTGPDGKESAEYKRIYRRS